MENKTIGHLNSKIWYRLLKVSYAFVFILVSAGAVAVISDNYKTRQLVDYRVACQYGNKASYLAYKDKGIYLSDDDLHPDNTTQLRMPDYGKFEDLQVACGIPAAEIQRPDLEPKPTPSFIPDPPYELFIFTKENVTTGGLDVTLGYSFLAVFIITLVFELIRRVFYYVILGIYKPAKLPPDFR